jgi:hypothetical protein
MAATLSLDTITSSGTNTEIPTGKVLKIADAGALKINDIAITTGAHATATSSTNPTTITSGNVTGKSNYALVFDASSGTSTDFVVNLPAPADFATTVITVKSNVAHGSGNKITIKNSGGTEVYTLYHVNDYCTFISDGTNTIRTGDEFVTIRGEVALTAVYTTASSTAVDLWDAAGANYTEVTDIGGCWSTTTDDFTVPHDGLYMLGGTLTGVAYCNGYGFKKNGTFIQAIDVAGIMYSNSMFGLKPHVLAAGDVITWWESEIAATTNNLDGNASAAMPRCTGDWWCLRRF